MAKAFAQLKNPALAPTDQLQVGKFKGCRVCDIAPDQYEYLIWMEQNKIITLTKESIALVQKYAGFAEEVRHYEEEVAPYLHDMHDSTQKDYYQNDLPF